MKLKIILSIPGCASIRGVGESAQTLHRPSRLATGSRSLSCSGTFYATDHSFSLNALDGSPVGKPAVIAAAAMLPVSAAYAAKKPPLVVTEGIKAYRLCTGPDNLSHVIEGSIDQKAMTDVSALHFKETPAHSTFDWHPAPKSST